MQYFLGPHGKTYAFDDDVAATETNGVWSFKTTSGASLSTPTNLTPCANNTPPPLPLAQAQTVKIATVRAACGNAIGAGFTSSALGVAYSYGGEQPDQANINAASASGNGGSLWCANSAGAWMLTTHTAAQAQQVRADLWAHIQACQAKYAELLAQIAEATTVAGVEAISW